MSRALGRLCTPSVPLYRFLRSFYSKCDVAEVFVAQHIMQHKWEKWHQHQRSEPPCAAPFASAQLPSPQELNRLFEQLIENGDSEKALNLTRKCLERGRSPPEALLLDVLSICSQNGDKELVLKLKETCENKGFVEQNANFAHFLAEAVWMSGDVSKAVHIFEEVYRENAFMRRPVRLMLNYLIKDLVANGSGAAVGNVLGFCERILRDFGDCSPMSCMWQACFLSEWFADQRTALELLEKHSALFSCVDTRIPYVVFISLKCHRTEIVYRLLEVLLKGKLRTQYLNVLCLLLDHHFQCGEWMRCSEIIHWAVDNEVPLPQKYRIQMINLVLNQKLQTPIAPVEEKKPMSDFKF